MQDSHLPCYPVVAHSTAFFIFERGIFCIGGVNVCIDGALTLRCCVLLHWWSYTACFFRMVSVFPPLVAARRARIEG